MPNMMETAIAMLAATSVGAVWSSCATDIGSQAALDRLGQIEPKVLFTVNGYYYKGKPFSSLGNAAEMAKGIPSLKKVMVASYADQQPDLSRYSQRASGGRISSPGRCNRLWNLNSCLPTIPCTSCSPRGPRASRSVWSRGLPAS